MMTNADSLFPIGHLAKTLSIVVDPLIVSRSSELSIGSEVTIEKVVTDGRRTTVKWITCRDSEGFLWNIRPGSLELIERDSEKKGRYYILKQNNKKIF